METVVVSIRWLDFVTLFSENVTGKKFSGFAICFRKLLKFIPGKAESLNREI